MASSSQKKEGRGVKSGETDLGKPSLNMEELRELADLVEERGFTDFEFENEKIRVRLSKATTPIVSAPPPAVSQPTAQQPVPIETPTAPPETESAEKEAKADDGLHTITSPIVGTFYRSPGPDKDPYVKEGDTVSPDSIVCIVEAMKLMNEISADASGKIVKIYVENGQPVEFGQPLFGIKE